MDVSIVIVNWNTRDLLRNCITSIYKNAGSVNYEIIVVDNHSADGSSEMVRSEFPDVVLKDLDCNKGYAAGSNAGIRAAKGRYILILNSDTLFCDRVLEKMVCYVDCHREAAVAGCQVWCNKDDIQMTCFQFPSLLNLFLRMSGLARIFKNNRFLGRGDMRWWHRDSEREVDVVSGMFMLVRREAIDEAGLMDEAYFLYYEETDWCYRFAKAGWKMMFWPGAKIIHLDGGGHSSKTQSLKLGIQMQKSQLFFFRKHYGFISFLLARVMLSFYTGLRFIEYILLLWIKRIRGRDFSFELAEMKKCGSVFKYLAFCIEPETY